MAPSCNRMTTGSRVQTPDHHRSGPGPDQFQGIGALPTLSPGAYTAIVEGVGGATGIGLVEVYDTSPVPGP